MKLSENTLNTLKNFSTINSGIVIHPGKIISTMSEDKSILAKAEVEDDFPVQCGIYDLNQFLGNVTTMENPELEFGDKSVNIKDTMFDLSYRYSAVDFIISPPKNKELAMDNPDVKFELTSAQTTKILRLASMNKLPNLSIVGRDGSLKLLAHEKGNDGAHTVSADLGSWDGPDMSAMFKTELLKMLPKDYMVEIKLGRFAKFVSTDGKLTYFISMETK